MLEKLGPYRIERLIGRGGMGAVYAAVHEETGQVAAVKALSAAIADNDRFRSRFAAEIATLKKLSHPNIVQLFGYGEEEGQLFFVMELVNGRSLQEELQAGRVFHWRDVIQIGIEVSQGLKHAHDCGVIHRDIKPANLLLTSAQTIKLTDFGIAKLFGASSITAEGSVIGTIDYMAPEQADGRPVSHRTDLYSLGAVLFTLLTRRPPFARSSLPQTIHSLRYDPAPSVRSLAPQIPESLSQVIDQLLRKDPEERVPTALILANSLRAMQHALAGVTRLDPAIQAPDSSELPTRVDEGDSDSESAPESITAPSLAFPPRSASSERPTNAPSWQQLTEVTSGTAGAPSTKVQEPPVRHKSTHFTEVSAESRRRPRTRAETAESRRERWLIAGMALALAGLIILIVMATRPPSAPQLYRQIKESLAAGNQPLAQDAIEEFERRFPDDPRLSEVRAWKLDIQSDYLQSRLALRSLKSGGTDLKDYEQAFLTGMRQRDKDPEAAKKLFSSLVEDYGQAKPSEDLQPYLAAARHQLARLQDAPHSPATATSRRDSSDQ